MWSTAFIHYFPGSCNPKAFFLHNFRPSLTLLRFFFRGFSIDSQFSLPSPANSFSVVCKPPCQPWWPGCRLRGRRGSGATYTPWQRPRALPLVPHGFGLQQGRTRDTVPASGRQPGRKEAVRFLILLVNFTLR